jgi:hypothetical protein
MCTPSQCTRLNMYVSLFGQKAALTFKLLAKLQDPLEELFHTTIFKFLLPFLSKNVCENKKSIQQIKKCLL